MTSDAETEFVKEGSAAVSAALLPTAPTCRRLRYLSPSRPWRTADISLSFALTLMPCVPSMYESPIRRTRYCFDWLIESPVGSCRVVALAPATIRAIR